MPTYKLTSESDTGLRPGDFPNLKTSARLADPVQASRDGTMFRSWVQDTIPNAATWWYVLRPPATGWDVWGKSRIVTVESDEIRVTFGKGGTLGDPVGDPQDAFNFDTVNGPPPQSVFQRYDAVTGATFESPDKLFSAPTTGPVTLPSDQTETGADVYLTNSEFAVFRVTEQNGANVPFTLFVTWQELPRPA
jgi:hypothetical protein